jgi:hypothetical protein
METLSMNRFLSAAAICSAVILIYSSDSAAAWDFSFLRTKAPARKMETNSGANAKSAAAAGETMQNDKTSGIGYTEFDGFNNIDDPLYREGSKVFLQKAMEADKVKAVSKDVPARHSVMRDAPSGIPAKTVQPAPARNSDENKAPAPPLKKNRLIKMIPADPLKAKSTL